MKKSLKLLSLLLILVMAMSMFTGCITVESDESIENAAEIDMTIGIPADLYGLDWGTALSEAKGYMYDFYKVNLKTTKIPTEEKELKKFMKKVEDGEIAGFFSDRKVFIDALIEHDALLPLETLRGTYDSILEEAPDGIITLAEDVKAMATYMYPLYGTYQGLYYNRTLLKELELPNPTSWENLMTVITGLKEKGYTPIAAGFADEGLEYMVDEMILTEGGTAEHSYQPTFGVVSSWERAANDIKTLENMGAFTNDCYNVNFEDAVQSFLDGSAGMIVAPSSAFGGNLSLDDVKAVGFPKTETGKREEGAFVGRIDFGFYISTEYFNKDERQRDALYELLCDDSMAYCYGLFQNESTFCPNPLFHEDNGVTKMDEALANLVGKAEKADWPMRDHLLTFDTTISCFRKALTGGDVMNCLQEAADAEIAAFDAQKNKG